MPAIDTWATKANRRVRNLQSLLRLIVPVPEEWLAQPAKSVSSGGPRLLNCAECSSYTELINAWRKALRWTDGLDRALSIMLASSASTMLVGEQLWIKIIGPPGCAKTTLLEGLSVNRQYVISKDTIRGFYTGWKDAEGQDYSIANLARGKTLATKDGDTLLRAPNLLQILSEARGLYDRAGRTHYRNAVMNDYEGHRMTWLLCGTPALREIDESELGCRFLDCVIMENIDDQFEQDVAWRAVNQEADYMLAESDGTPDSQHPPDLLRAMRLTGGYLTYLRENILLLLPGVLIGPAERQQCVHLARLVAHLRARPHGSSQTAEAGREFSARLAKQLLRLAGSLAVVLNRQAADHEVMRRVRQVALDTARGLSLNVIRHLRKVHPRGLDPRSLELYLSCNRDLLSHTLRFMRAIGIIETYTPEVPGRSGQRLCWRLTVKMLELYDKVLTET